jgi:hypothetical protein
MPIFLKGNHQLESRMQEICQSGSEGGAKLTFVPTPMCAWEYAPTVGWKSLSDRNTGLSVAEGNCVAERRGGEQPEANDQSIIKKMMNSIRPDALASLRF